MRTSRLVPSFDISYCTRRCLKGRRRPFTTLRAYEDCSARSSHHIDPTLRPSNLPPAQSLPTL